MKNSSANIKKAEYQINYTEGENHYEMFVDQMMLNN